MVFATIGNFTIDVNEILRVDIDIDERLVNIYTRSNYVEDDWTSDIRVEIRNDHTLSQAESLLHEMKPFIQFQKGSTTVRIPIREIYALQRGQGIKAVYICMKKIGKYPFIFTIEDVSEEMYKKMLENFK